jgi:hypothetical protein
MMEGGGGYAEFSRKVKQENRTLGKLSDGWS